MDRSPVPHHAAMTAPRHEEFRPDVLSRRVVHRAWLTETRSPLDDFLIVPDGCVDLVYSDTGGLQLVGTMTSAQTLMLPGGVDIVGVRFQPGGAAPWLRADMAGFTDKHLPLREVMGAAVVDWEDRLRATEDLRDRAQLLCAQVAGPMVSCWQQAHPRDLDLRRALDALVRAEGELSIEWLALQCNLSTRQFQRRCLAATGLPPKRLARVLRLMRSLRHRQLTGAPWTAVAAECGFADQAHFTHDFTELVGCGPEAYAKRDGDVRFSQVRDNVRHVQSPIP